MARHVYIALLRPLHSPSTSDAHLDTLRSCYGCSAGACPLADPAEHLFLSCPELHLAHRSCGAHHPSLTRSCELLRSLIDRHSGYEHEKSCGWPRAHARACSPHSSPSCATQRPTGARPLGIQRRRKRTSGLQLPAYSPPLSCPRPVTPTPSYRCISSSQLTPWQEPNDLSFSAGEIVEIVDETNSYWWTGKCRGKQGLFPSNHVEKIDSRAAAGASPPPPSMPMMPVSSAPSYYSPPPPGPPQQYGMPSNPEKAALYQSHYAPPPPAPMVMQSPAPVQVQQAPEQPPKKNKFGKLGSTMATSAAGGVGFGAGA